MSWTGSETQRRERGPQKHQGYIYEQPERPQFPHVPAPRPRRQYKIKAGTPVNVAKPGPGELLWKQHKTKIDLTLAAKAEVHRDHAIFRHLGYLIQVRNQFVETQ